MSRSGPSRPDPYKPTRDLDPTMLSRLLGQARPSNANLELADPELEREIAEGTAGPTPLADLAKRFPPAPSQLDVQTERLPVMLTFPLARPSVRISETLELPIDELSLDHAEIEPLENVRAQRAFLRIDTRSDEHDVSPQLQPTPQRRAATSGTSMTTRRRVPWLACGIALVASGLVTALLFAH